jgi:hypothetical protein
VPVILHGLSHLILPNASKQVLLFFYRKGNGGCRKLMYVAQGHQLVGDRAGIWAPAVWLTENSTFHTLFTFVIAK